jgi:D-tagatose-bisphosphate aldolase class II non-catalytic subunit
MIKIANFWKGRPMIRSPSLGDLPRHHRETGKGIVSICSAQPVVIEAAMRASAEREGPLLIEATCNQVNQEGGYTGMTPRDFRRFVEGVAVRVGFDPARLILGGDHLGPSPWRDLSVEEALGRAERMVDAYVRAGFAKIHLDTSMGCAGEAAAVSDAVTAERAARLARIAEVAAQEVGTPAPHYVIGTEVPVPGGATESLDHMRPTSPESVQRTVDVHRAAFVAVGQEAAFERAIGLVVQPGVEFSSESVRVYDRTAARELAAAGRALPNLVFEAHSTDYQPESALTALVQDGFAILKVGPALTFSLREALYGLDAIRAFMLSTPDDKRLPAAMEALMLARPQYWRAHYHGDEEALRRQRHYSYSDRIRYYWTIPEAARATEALLASLQGVKVLETLVSQHLNWAYPALMTGRCSSNAASLIEMSIRKVIETYDNATA